MVKNEKIEDEIESEVRRRTRGKHVEIASITIEAVEFAPEIANAVRAKLVAEQDALRQKAGVDPPQQPFLRMIAGRLGRAGHPNVWACEPCV